MSILRGEMMNRAILVLVGLVLFTDIAIAQETPRPTTRGSRTEAQAAPPVPTQPPGPFPSPEEPARFGRRRGAEGAGPTSAPTAGNVDEKPVVTHHDLKLSNGKTLTYTATVQQMPLKNNNGDTEAHICYTAYTLDGADPTTRPLTFAFNGGPGAASIWVHMGTMGPRRAALTDVGEMPPPPFKLVDNDQTWLDDTDLVFIDPVGTGYSRARSQEIARRMNGVDGDLQSVGDFIQTYVTKNDRWLSPIFIAGESYGTFRTAGLAGRLIDQGLALNGIVLISTVLDFGMLRPGLGNNLSYAVHLPTYAADAFYHHKLAPELSKDLKATLKEVEAWAMGEYLDVLNKGDDATADERKAVVQKMARYTGLEPRYVENSNMRVDVSHFTRELLRNEKLEIGRYDGRLTGPAPLDAGERTDFDPSGTQPRPPFQAAFQHYIKSELGYDTDLRYYVQGGILPWDWGQGNRMADTTDLLQNAFQKNPYFKVMVVAGYYDLATPYFSVKYTMNHLGTQPEAQKRITWQYYECGHMVYIEKNSRAKLKKDFSDFVRSAIPSSQPGQ